jgi:hypothetical protein
MWNFVMDKSGAGAGFLRELMCPLPIYIPSASPQSSSLSPEACTIGPLCFYIPVLYLFPQCKRIHFRSIKYILIIALYFHLGCSISENIREIHRPTHSGRKKSENQNKISFFLISGVGLWVLRPLLAHCTSPG